MSEKDRGGYPTGSLADEVRSIVFAFDSGDSRRDAVRELADRVADALARAWEEGAEAAFDAQNPGPDSDYIRPLFGRALDEFYASNPYRTKGRLGFSGWVAEQKAGRS